VFQIVLFNTHSILEAILFALGHGMSHIHLLFSYKTIQVNQNQRHYCIK
jgi:hypothetical protein